MTPTEREKMLAGDLYRSTDPELQAAAAQAQILLRRLNATPNEDLGLRQAVLQALLGSIGELTQVKSPFSCDYGWNIHVGRNGFINYGCTFLDCNSIRIGDDAQIGPGVQIYTALHPLDAHTRRSGLETAKPVTVGHNVWLGGSCVICPGVSIGDNTVVGAGAVVVRDLPANALAVGNPCKVIRQLF
ncbi:MAG: maltose acetyltransferase [Acidobacteria bacterium]|nr:MAG: maltose acetyltransferase [Acidobacteriota bacterium]